MFHGFRSRLYWKFVLVSAVVVAAMVLKNFFILTRLSSGQTIEHLWRQNLVLSAIIALMVLAAGLIHFRLISKYVRRILKGMAQVRNREYPHLLVEGEDELSDLLRGFNEMVEELRTRDDKLKNLAEERQAEVGRLSERLAQERQRIETVVDAVGDGIIVVDEQGGVLTVNRRAGDIFGVPTATLAHVPVSSLIDQIRHRLRAPADAEQRLAELLRNPGQITDILLQLDEPGEPGIRIYPVALKGAAGDVVARIASALESSREQELDRLKAEFISTISHELRTPLTSIKGALGLIHGGAAGMVSADMRELLEIALNNTDRLIHVVNEILDVAQLEHGQARIHPAPMWLGDTINNAVQSVAAEQESRRVAIEIQLSPVLPAVYADSRRIEQVLVNLLSNAIKFSPSGQRVIVAARPEDGQVQVSVQDFGRGMTKAFRDRLFVKFEHAQDALIRESQGAGLGLAICRYVVEAHGGRIWADGQEGEGSTFYFTLRAAAGFRPAQTAAGEQLAQAPIVKERLILVVDDDEDVTRVLSFAFESEGYRVLRCCNGRDAIHLARRHLPDLLTLDLKMPDTDGFAVLDALRQDPKTRSIPVICISVQPDCASAASHGADYCLEKPIDIAKLRRVTSLVLQAERKVVSHDAQ